MLRSVGALSLVCAVSLSLSHDRSLDAIVVFVERYLSPDHQLEPETVTLIAGYFFFLKAFLVLTGVLLVTPIGNILWLAFLKIWGATIDTPKLENVLFVNSQLPEKTEKRFFVVSTAGALLTHLFVLTIGEPEHEGALETISSFGLLIAGLLAFYALFQARAKLEEGPVPKNTKLFLCCLALGLLILFGEEVSWGQRVFGWESFGIFEKYNYQKETTVHNFFNPLFAFIYPAVGISFFVFCVFFWLFPSRKPPALLTLFAPPPSFCALIFVMAGLTFRGHSEAFEELLAFFFVLYTYRMALILRNLKAC